MSRKNLVAGILVSLIVPIVVYLALAASIHLIRLQEPSDDFQYHDSYFTVMHIDPYLFPLLAVITFTIYGAISWFVRYMK
ncbi:hypothetical protein [Paenibacillus oryzisoli]|uniref:Uncharacterized protein n=1 Tax=Paenibacillus oryzisoli TaxID=1850517 RepID=A0A198A0S1_9BACL|nr:hypothetical protein [Paenibacillus oryzisoli]OAS15059.1 hypothetical protein A8708_22255 [Paenibacillus oryzisoli]